MSGDGAYGDQIPGVELLFAIPSIGAESASPGDAGVHAGDVGCEQLGLSPEPVVPDEDGWTTIDFNRAYNAPCVFTPFSVCALPPRANWLQLPVTAGEKRPAVPVY